MFCLRAKIFHLDKKELNGKRFIKFWGSTSSNTYSVHAIYPLWIGNKTSKFLDFLDLWTSNSASKPACLAYKGHEPFCIRGTCLFKCGLPKVSKTDKQRWSSRWMHFFRFLYRRVIVRDLGEIIQSWAGRWLMGSRRSLVKPISCVFMFVCASTPSKHDLI